MIKTEGRSFEDVQAELVNWIEGEMHEISPLVYGNKETSEIWWENTSLIGCWDEHCEISFHLTFYENDEAEKDSQID